MNLKKSVLFKRAPSLILSNGSGYTNDAEAMQYSVALQRIIC
jgi:hypothetical protein